MFTNKDIEVFDNKIDDLEDSAEILTDKVNEGLIKNQKAIISIIESYIKEHQLIVYGGNAQNLAIKKIDPKGVFYDDKDVHDYDVYSFDPRTDAINLTKQIFKAGFKNILAIEAIHVETYSIKYYGTPLCDFSYMPKYIFDNLPILSVDGFKIVNPYLAYIDFMRMFNDPLTSSSFRWSKNFERFNMMQKYYPLTSKELKNDMKDNIDKSIEKDLRKIISKSYSLIYTGIECFNTYASLCKCDKLGLEYLTLVSTNYLDDVKMILSELKKKYNITTQERYPFFQFWDFSIDIRINDKLVCKIYKNNNICIPFKEVKNVKYASFTYNLMWVMIEKFYYSIYDADCSGRPKQNNEIIKRYDQIINGMLFIKDKYLKEHKKTFLDDTIFQHFVTDKCSGVPLNPSDIKNSIKNYRGFKYDPNKKTVNNESYIYTNISGRFINSIGNKFIKNN